MTWPIIPIWFRLLAWPFLMYIDAQEWVRTIRVLALFRKSNAKIRTVSLKQHIFLVHMKDRVILVRGTNIYGGADLAGQESSKYDSINRSSIKIVMGEPLFVARVGSEYACVHGHKIVVLCNHVHYYGLLWGKLFVLAEFDDGWSAVSDERRLSGPHYGDIRGFRIRRERQRVEFTVVNPFMEDERVVVPRP